MAWIDIIIVIFLGFGGIRGLKRGFFLELAALAGLVLGVWAGIHFSSLAAALLKESFHLQGAWLPFLSFVIVFTAVLAVVWFLGKLAEKSAELLLMGWISKLMGMAFGILKQAFILSFLFFILNFFAADGDIVPIDQKKKSVLYGPLKSIATFFIPSTKSNPVDII